LSRYLQYRIVKTLKTFGIPQSETTLRMHICIAFYLILKYCVYGWIKFV
jgi:hypothetical protein